MSISEPSDLTLKIYRAESYAGLQEFKAAIEDLNAVLFQLPNWPEVRWLTVTFAWILKWQLRATSLRATGLNRMDGWPQMKYSLELSHWMFTKQA